MKRSAKVLGVVAVLVTVGCSVDQPTSAMQESQDANRTTTVAAGRTPTGLHIVQYAPGTMAQARATVTAAGARVVRDVPQLDMLFIQGMAGASAASLAATSGIVSIAEDRTAGVQQGRPVIVRQASSGPRTAAPNQSGAFFYSRQWNMRITNANVAWAATNGGAGEYVCVLSSGIDDLNPDLVGKIDFMGTAFGARPTPYPTDKTPFDHYGIGTMMAAIISSKGWNVASVAPNARLCSMKVVSEDGSVNVSEAILGMVLAADLNPDVMALGFAFHLDRSDPNDVVLLGQLNAAVAYAHSKRVAVVAMAGDGAVNYSLQPRPYRFFSAPSMIQKGILAGGDAGVIGVGATAPFDLRNFDMLAPYTNRGSTETMDLVAPGGRVPDALVALSDNITSACSHYASTACDNFSAAVAAGTSLSAAMVAGAAAVAEAAVRSRSTEPVQMTPSAMAVCLRRTAAKVGPPATYGAGRLNVLAAAMGCNVSG